MLRTLVPCLALLAAAAPLPAAGPAIPFGSGPAAVGFATPATHPGAFGLPLPMGPAALRAEHGRLYLLDGLNRRLLLLAADGTVTGSVPIPGAGPLPWLGDFALQRDAQGKVRTLWVVDRLDAAVLAIDPAGQLLRKVGGSDDPASPLRDPRRIEVGASGRLYVEDQGLRSIVVFSASGTVERRIPTRARGFFLDAAETLHRLDWDEATGKTSLLREGLDAPASPPQPLPLVTQAMPELWFPLESGALVLTHPAPEPDQGSPQLAWCSPDGRTRGGFDWSAPEGMVRPLAPAGGEAILKARADLARAPAGVFAIETRDLGADPEG